MTERCVAITGASSGLGRDLAQEYASRGWRVIGVGRRPRDAANLDGAIEYVRFDLDQIDALDRLADDLVREGQHLDMVVHSAALYGSLGPDELSSKDYVQYYRVNALAPYLLSRALMRKQGNEFTLFATMNSECAYHTGTNITAYSASKAALLSLTRSLALEYKQSGCSFATLVLGPLANVRKAAGMERFAERLHVSVQEATRKWIDLNYRGAVIEDFIHSRGVARSIDALYDLQRDGNGAIWRLDGGSIDLLF